MRDIWAFKYHLGAGAPKQLSTHGVKKLLNRAWWKQGLRKPLTNGSRRHECKAAQGFIKFYKTTAEQAGMLAINVETLMERRTGMSDHYARPREYDLLKDYLNIVDSLTIYKKQMDIKEFSENQQAITIELDKTRDTRDESTVRRIKASDSNYERTDGEDV
jgi:hypothetical protein